VQRAEVAVYFKRFDEAEQLYFKMDRPDLAVDMRMRLGRRDARPCTTSL
jgi:WD repeat-containing protein 35